MNILFSIVGQSLPERSLGFVGMVKKAGQIQIYDVSATVNAACGVVLHMIHGSILIWFSHGWYLVEASCAQAKIGGVGLSGFGTRFNLGSRERICSNISCTYCLAPSYLKNARNP